MLKQKTSKVKPSCASGSSVVLIIPSVKAAYTHAGMPATLRETRHWPLSLMYIFVVCPSFVPCESLVIPEIEDWIQSPRKAATVGILLLTTDVSLLGSPSHSVPLECVCVCVCVCLSVCLPVYLSVCLSTCLYLCCGAYMDNRMCPMIINSLSTMWILGIKSSSSELRASPTNVFFKKINKENR